MISVRPLNDSNKIYNICLVSSFGSRRNIGDEGVLVAAVYSLKREIPNVRIIATCTDPEYIQRVYDIETIRTPKKDFKGIRRKKKVFKAFKEADLIIWLGGVRFYDSGYLGKLLQYGLARLLRKQTMFCGVGALPIKSKVGKLITRHIVNWSDSVTVRNESSVGLLRELKVKKDIILTADSGFLLQPVLSDRVEKRLNEISGTPKKAPLIGIVVGCFSNRQWRTFGLPPFSEELYKDLKLNIAKVADIIMDDLGQVLFIPQQFPPQMPAADDRVVCREIAALMKRKDRIKVLDDTRYTAQELCGVIGELGLLLSGRFHGLVFAAINSVPMVAVGRGLGGHGFDNRVYELMESIGQGSLVCDMEDFDYNDCASKLEYAWSHRDSITQEIRTKVEVLKGKAALNAKLARELLS